MLQGWDYVRYVMIKRLTASSYPVGMPELVKDVLPESRTLVNLVPTAGREFQQLIIFICNTEIMHLIIYMVDIDIAISSSQYVLVIS